MPKPSDVVELSVELMKHDSTSGRETAAMEWLDRYLADRGWRVQRIPVSDGRFDVLVTWGDAPGVTFSTHIDTVPPYIAPRLEGDTLWGRGACDAKGIAASMICAAEKLRDRNEAVALLFVVGEEVTHDGAEAANRLPTTSRVLINGEPTENKLAIATKGAMRFTLRTRGRAAHSAYPHLGRSAITELVRLLAEIKTLRLPADPQLGETTINIGKISGGVADNVMAPSAEAHLMARLVTPSTELERALRAWTVDRAELEIGSTVELARLGTIPGFETCVAAFATDIPKLTNWGKPFLYGPGSIHLAHRDDEHVRVAELRGAVDAYVRIATAAVSSSRTE
jgi:acetylornithine deacetylase